MGRTTVRRSNAGSEAPLLRLPFWVPSCLESNYLDSKMNPRHAAAAAAFDAAATEAKREMERNNFEAPIPETLEEIEKHSVAAPSAPQAAAMRLGVVASQPLCEDKAKTYFEPPSPEKEKRNFDAPIPDTIDESLTNPGCSDTPLVKEVSNETGACKRDLSAVAPVPHELAVKVWIMSDVKSLVHHMFSLWFDVLRETVTHHEADAIEVASQCMKNAQCERSLKASSMSGTRATMHHCLAVWRDALKDAAHQHETI